MNLVQKRHWLRREEAPRRYDLHRLKRTVCITTVLTHYGLDAGLRWRRGERVGVCPLPNHGGDRNNRKAFRVHPHRGVWRCLTHCGGGDIVGFVALLEGGDYARAARVLAALESQYEVATRPADIGPHRRAFVPYTRQLRLHVEHPYLHARSILPQTARAFEAGWWPLGGFLEGCVGVRLHDPFGQPLGYAGRRVEPAAARRLGKWTLPSCLPRSELLFNWHRVAPLACANLVVVEGPFDAMRVWQATRRPVVALLGATATAAQRARLAKVPRVTLMLDADEAGRAATRELLRTLDTARVSVLQLPAGRDPADLSDTELRSLVLEEEGIAM